MSSADLKETVSLTIDGRPVRAPAGGYVLQAASRIGVEIPTLCDHPDLEPVGACRLCMVEVTHPDWNGWSGLMTSCLYPVAEGLQISTKSPRVLKARQGILALLSARCPTSARIQALAQSHGVASLRSQLLIDPDVVDDCILCGLCVRVCTTYATGAIATCSRGSTKRVGTFSDAPPDECVGCGACASICPTGNIPSRRRVGSYSIWQRSFDTAAVTVDAVRCVGCGACEEACPFAVARVVLRVGGPQVATIPQEHCRGCGACVGACPTGALDQPGRSCWNKLLHRISAEDTGDDLEGGEP